MSENGLLSTPAVDECLKYGLTTVHEADTTAAMLDALRSLRKKGKLKCRIYVMLDGTDHKLLEPFFIKGLEIDARQILTVRSIKIFIDGALGSRGAALLEPYSDAPDTRGVIVTSEDSLYQLTVRALKSGLQVAVHAIGDRANRIALNAYSRALAEVPGVKDHRLRVEHAQVVSLEDILNMPSQRLLSLHVEQTYVGGKLIYDRILEKHTP
jgi:predicted amidohydrolase YtcJ